MVEHIPVLLQEVLEYLQPKPGQNFVDATLGGGGHTRAIAKLVYPDGIVIGIDRDQEAIDRARGYGSNVTPVHGNYSDIERIVRYVSPDLQVNGVLIDCGLSSTQLGDSERGFSFLHAGPLDMRMDKTQAMTAAVIVNNWSENDLADLFWRLGEERRSRRAAAAIVAARRQKSLATTGELSEIIAAAFGGRGRLNPATKIFQALRMEVNKELDGLEAGLRGSLQVLARGGRLAVITFHSLEDRLTKNLFKATDAKHFKIITKHVVKPTREEILTNPRARSAKLRVIEKI
jgi:16S rRNA (cytosine1402-N4)-methyltransferase